MSNTHTLTRFLQAIDRSLLLSEERKRALREWILHAGTEDLRTLEALLMEEDGIVLATMRRAIEQAVERDDRAFLTSLDTFLHDAMRTLHRADERMEQSTDISQAEIHLHDA